MKVAILGMGVVGRGVYDILTEEQPSIEIKYVLERNLEKTQGLKTIVAGHIEEILEDDEVDVLIELIGGKSVAYEFVKLALKHKKHVVTANKALISAYFEELHELAKKQGVSLRYEASVGGAINVIDPLYEIANINRIHKIEGIMNGSTNYILTNVFDHNKSLSDVLDDALELGYLETGTNDDMEGLDLMRKINILSMIAYHQYIKEEDILRVPLTNLTPECIDLVKKHNLTIKYIATSTLKNDAISIQLEPVILTKNHFYQQISGAENIITLYGAYHKKQSFIGTGAGRYPTASAVCYDVLKIMRHAAVKQDYSNQYQITNQEQGYYLIEENDQLVITKQISLDSLLKSKTKVCARIHEEAYEIL